MTFNVIPFIIIVLFLIAFGGGMFAIVRWLKKGGRL